MVQNGRKGEGEKGGHVYRHVLQPPLHGTNNIIPPPPLLPITHPPSRKLRQAAQETLPWRRDHPHFHLSLPLLFHYNPCIRKPRGSRKREEWWGQVRPATPGQPLHNTTHHRPLSSLNHHCHAKMHCFQAIILPSIERGDTNNASTLLHTTALLLLPSKSDWLGLSLLLILIHYLSYFWGWDEEREQKEVARGSRGERREERGGSLPGDSSTPPPASPCICLWGIGMGNGMIYME